MKSTHHALPAGTSQHHEVRCTSRRTAIFPAHLSMIPTDVAITISALSQKLDQEDARLEHALLSSLRAQRLSSRIPALVEALAKHHPELSNRSIFRILEVYTGVSVGHIRRLTYSMKGR